MRSKMFLAMIITAMIGMEPAPTTAAGLDEVHDTQCLALAALMTDADKTGPNQAALLSSLFFMGKLFGRNPDYDIVAAMKPIIETLNPDSIKTLAAECGTELALRGKQMEQAGAALKALDR